MCIGRLLLRLFTGAIFFGHGTQKLFGWFGGHGLEATSQMFDGIGARPGRHNAIAAGVAEAGGGALMLLGLATPLAASAFIATMLTAIERVHISKGLWVTEGGYEYNLVLIASALTLAEVGPGPMSVDASLGDRLHGPRWALFSLVSGALGSLGAHLYSASQPEPLPTDTAEQPAEQPEAQTAESAQTTA